MQECKRSTGCNPAIPLYYLSERIFRRQKVPINLVVLRSCPHHIPASSCKIFTAGSPRFSVFLVKKQGLQLCTGEGEVSHPLCALWTVLLSQVLTVQRLWLAEWYMVNKWVPVPNGLCYNPWCQAMPYNVQNPPHPPCHFGDKNTFPTTSHHCWHSQFIPLGKSIKTILFYYFILQIFYLFFIKKNLQSSPLP